MTYYSSNLGPYLAANKPGCVGRAHDNGEGVITLQGWDENLDGAAPTEGEVEAWDPAGNLTDVEIMTPVFIDYRRQATLHMDGLKAQVWSYLKNEQEMDPALATAAGVAFCKSSTGIGVQYDDYIKAGGHPDAATDLWARIQEIKAGFAWFDAGVEAIFAAALGQEV